MGKGWSVGEFLATLLLLAGQVSGREEPSWLGVGPLGAKSLLEGLELLSSLTEGVTFGVRARPPLGLV